MATQTAPMTHATQDPARSRFFVLFVVLAVTSALGAVLMALWPEPSGNDFYSYGEIAPIRDRWWVVGTLMAAGFAINIPAQAVAAMAVARQRGATWATVGAVTMVVGAALQATAIAGWTTLYYYATGPGLDASAATAFLDSVGSDSRLFAVALPAALLVVTGTVLQAVGLWRSRAIPRWVPILSLLILPTFFMPAGGLSGLLGQLPLGVAAVALGWYAWRRA
jgi:hypothetical protein